MAYCFFRYRKSATEVYIGFYDHVVNFMSHVVNSTTMYQILQTSFYMVTPCETFSAPQKMLHDHVVVFLHQKPE